MNDIKTWQQGEFINSKKYSRWSEEEVKRAQSSESLLVRPSPKGNAICVCKNPNDAKWIAERLNLASQLEQMTYDFATGKADSSEIIKLIQSKTS